jgi:hypothetical protein
MNGWVLGTNLRTAVQCLMALLLLCLGAQAQDRYRKLPQEAVEKRLESAAESQSERAAYLRRQFVTAGCSSDKVTDDAVLDEKQPNIVCVIPGRTSRQIVVGAHYDFIVRGRGIVDNWSGASMLPSLIESLTNEKRDHTFVFVAFTGEEQGMVGSKSYVAKLSKEQRQAIAAMVNLDTLGLGPTKVWATDSTTPLVDALFKVAGRINSPLAVMNVDGAGQSDNDSFREANIPEICIHSVTQDSWRVLHSKDDQLTAIRKDDYYETYRLLSAYLAEIDGLLDSAASKDASPK